MAVVVYIADREASRLRNELADLRKIIDARTPSPQRYHFWPELPSEPEEGPTPPEVALP